MHVSEQGFHEEVPSPPSFGGEEKLSDDSVDNQLSLTVDSLRRHTKAQELLYLQVRTIYLSFIDVNSRKRILKKLERSAEVKILSSHSD